MQGITFGTYHSYRAWGLMLKSKPFISPPIPKTKLIEVPGTDLVIDLTQKLSGKVTYEQREIKLEFITIANRNEWDKLLSDVLNALHGQRLKIVLDSDPDYYYIGRVFVSEPKYDKAAMIIPVTAKVEPYKYERHGAGRRL